MASWANARVEWRCPKCETWSEAELAWLRDHRPGLYCPNCEAHFSEEPFPGCGCTETRYYGAHHNLMRYIRERRVR